MSDGWEPDVVLYEEPGTHPLIEGLEDEVLFYCVEGCASLGEDEPVPARGFQRRGKGRADLLRQVLGQDNDAAFENNDPLDDILQLPYVPRPGVSCQELRGVG